LFPPDLQRTMGGGIYPLGELVRGAFVQIPILTALQPHIVSWTSTTQRYETHVIASSDDQAVRCLPRDCRD